MIRYCKRLAIGIGLAIATPAVAAVETFTDTFNRPDGAVSNGWLPMQGNPNDGLVIQNGALAPQLYNGSVAGIYRTADLSGFTRATATLTEANGLDGFGNRFESFFSFGSSVLGGAGSGLQVGFIRSGQLFNNSAVSLFFDGQEIGRLASTFQFGQSITPTVYVSSDGRVSGSVAGSGQTFSFDFQNGPYTFGSNSFGVIMADPDVRAGNIITPTLDNFALTTGLSGIVPILPNPPPPTTAPKPIRLEGNVVDFDPSRPTVIITHGWQPVPITGDPSWVGDMADQITDITPNLHDVNVIQVYWDDAKTLLATAEALRSATAQVAYQGRLLATELAVLGGNFENGIQFIGHSLGTHVNAYAAHWLTASGTKVDQFTILDRPFGLGIRPNDIFTPLGGDADQRIFRSLLNKDEVRVVDNYFGRDYSLPTPSTGAAFTGVAQALDIELADRDHVGVHKWYAGSIINNGCSLAVGGFGCSRYGGGFSEILTGRPWDPKQQNLVLPSQTIMLRPNDWLRFNCAINGQETVVTCTESSPAYLWIENYTFASDAQFLSFDFAWLNGGDGDWLTLYFGNTLLYSGTGTGFQTSEFFSSGLLTVSDFAGKSGQLLFSLNNAGARNAQFSIRDIKVFTSPAAVPESETWAMFILGFGLIGIGFRRARLETLAAK